MNSAHWVLDKS